MPPAAESGANRRGCGENRGWAPARGPGRRMEDVQCNATGRRCVNPVALAGEDGREPHGVTGLCRASPAAALNAADDTNGGIGAAASAGAERGADGSLADSVRDDNRGVLLHRSSSMSFALPAAVLPAAGPCFARTARGRGRPLAPARFAHLIARARRRTHLSRAFLRGFSRMAPPGRATPKKRLRIPLLPASY